MRVIRTRSLMHYVRRYSLVIITGLVLALAGTAVWADTPPQPLLDHISSQRLVYNKKCDVKSLRLTNVECMIFFDDTSEVVWVVLYDDKLDIMRIISAKEGKETYVWCRSNICT
jgi:hypothetical protein